MRAEGSWKRAAKGGAGALRLGALVASSALFGGIAAVIWNRAMLKRLRAADSTEWTAEPVRKSGQDWLEDV